MTVASDQKLDCSGMACPMPILKTKKAVDALQIGQVLKMIATDPGSVSDMTAWTAKTGQEHHIEYRIRHPDGTIHWLETHGIPLADRRCSGFRSHGRRSRLWPTRATATKILLDPVHCHDRRLTPCGNHSSKDRHQA